MFHKRYVRQFGKDSANAARLLNEKKHESVLEQVDRILELYDAGVITVFEAVKRITEINDTIN